VNEMPPPPPFGLSTESFGHGRLVVVRMIGDLDLSAVEPTMTYLAGVTSGRPDHLVLDLAQVTFLSSRGLALLVEAQLGHFGIRGTLHLLGVTGHRPVARIMDMAGLTDRFDIRAGLPELLGELDITTGPDAVSSGDR
jgi:anti-sigma B factor antagonist